MLHCVTLSPYLRLEVIMRCNIHLFVLLVALFFSIPVLAAQAPPDCPRAAQASAAGSACRDVVVPGKYPFSELLDQPPESGFGLACATLLLGLFALRAVLR
jgi:hypothetical protein